MDQRVPTPRPIIYVVEDDAAVRRALEFALDLEGFEVESYSSGEALLLREPIRGAGCLVIDERLPGASGQDTLRQLRARFVTIPALLITSHPKAALREAAAKTGTPILEKPLEVDVLVAAIRDLLVAPTLAPPGATRG